MPGYNAVVTKPPAQHMQCMEVWGGSQLTARDVEMGGLASGSTASPSAQRSAAETFTTLRVAPPAAFPASCWPSFRTRHIRRRYRSRPAHPHAALRQPLGPGGIRPPLNQQFIAISQAATFATAVVTTFFAPAGVSPSATRDIPAFYFTGSAQRQWNFLGSR